MGLEYPAGLLLCLSHLLVQNLLLLVLQLGQVLSLFLNHLLADILLLLEPLFLPIFLELIDPLLLLRIVLLSLALLALLLGELLLVRLELLVRMVQLLPSARLLRLALHLLHSLLLQLLQGLALHQLSLQQLLLVGFDVLHFGLVELVLDHFGSFLFALVHLFESLVHFAVVVLHFELVVFDPALFDLLIVLLASHFQVDLCVTLLQDVCQHHLSVEGLHLILRVVHLLVCLLQRLQSLCLVKCVLLFVDTSSL